MNDNDNIAVLRFVVALLVVGTCYLLYLEWWESGELALLSRRLEVLEHPPVPPKRQARKPSDRKEVET